MRKIFLTVLTVIMFAFQSAQAQPSPQWVQNLPVAQEVNQMVVVAATYGSSAIISMHEKKSLGEWEQILSTPGFIGQNGLGKTREGDHKTPVGTFYFDFAFGIKPDPGCAFEYHQIDANHYWSGDWNYKYNQFVDIREAPYNFDTTYSEHLIGYNPFYNYALNMGYNAECTPGRGSALFMHCSKPGRPFTMGCVAMTEDKMLFIMQHIQPGCACVIDSLTNLGGMF